MSFGEGNLRERVEELERENGRLRSLLAKELYHLRENALHDHAPQWSWVYKVEAEADELGVRYTKEHVGTLPKRVDEHMKLESLARDMLTCCEAGECDECSREGFCRGTVDFADRMAELGIEVGA